MPRKRLPFEVLVALQNQLDALPPRNAKRKQLIEETCQRLPSGRSLNKSERTKLYRSCSQDKTSTGKRDHAVIALMLATGIRRSEVIAINIDDYDARTGVLTIQSGKGNKQRRVHLNTKSRQTVRQWLITAFHSSPQ